MAEQKKVGSATGAAVLILFEGGGSAGSVLIFLYFFIFFLIEMYLTLTWRSVERGAAFLDQVLSKSMRSSVVWKRKQHAILLDNAFFDCTTHPSYRTSTRTVKTTRLLLAINK